MPTKDELIAFASEVGVDVSSSALKSEIEAALYDAGYDPLTLEAPEVTETEPEATDPVEDWADAINNLSSDSAHSTYAESAEVDPDERPAPGRLVEQTRGEAAET